MNELSLWDTSASVGPDGRAGVLLGGATLSTINIKRAKFGLISLLNAAISGGVVSLKLLDTAIK